MKEYTSYLDQDYLVNLTQELIRIATPNPPADYSVIHRRMRSLMQEAGLETVVLEGKPGKPNVLGLWRGSDPGAPTLLLDAHMDVVPAGEGWKHDPYSATIEDGIMWGRGSADMKHSLATMIAVVRALKSAGFTPRGNLMVSATVDDETAGHWGLKYVLETGLASIGWPRPDFHLLLEPSNWDVNVAFKGRVWIRIGIKGKSAHGGSPEKGVSAILKMARLIDRLIAMKRYSHSLMPQDSLNVGTISGGEKVNIVPDTCVAEFDYRFVGPYSADDAIARFKEVVAQCEAEDPEFMTSEFTVFEKRDPVEILPEHPVLALLASCIREEPGRSARPSGVLSAGNAYWSLSHGIPATMTGPGDAAIIHTNKEHISIKDLLEGARIVTRFVTRF